MHSHVGQAPPGFDLIGSYGENTEQADQTTVDKAGVGLLKVNLRPLEVAGGELHLGRAQADSLSLEYLSPFSQLRSTQLRLGGDIGHQPPNAEADQRGRG
jgi:hypothetical protein